MLFVCCARINADCPVGMIGDRERNGPSVRDGYPPWGRLSNHLESWNKLQHDRKKKHSDPLVSVHSHESRQSWQERDGGEEAEEVEGR